MQMMDDGVSLAYTLYTPDGAAPAGGWPGVVVLHGLGRHARLGRGDLHELRQRGLRRAGLRRPRPRRIRRRRHARRAARGRRPEGGPHRLRRPRDVSDTKIGAWGISYGGGQIWNALAAGVPFAAVEVVETWTSLYDALWPQNLARSGIVAGFANSVAARSPLVASIRDEAVQSTNPAAIRQLTAERSALPKIGSIRTPVYLFQGRVDFAFDLTQATQAFGRLGGPKKLYAGNFGHPPVDVSLARTSRTFARRASPGSTTSSRAGRTASRRSRS